MIRPRASTIKQWISRILVIADRLQTEEFIHQQLLHIVLFAKHQHGCIGDSDMGAAGWQEVVPLTTYNLEIHMDADKAAYHL